MDVVYGRNPVLEALRAERPARKLVVAEGIRHDARVHEILGLAEAAGIRIETSPRRRLDDIAHSEHHQGVAGYFHTRPPLRLEDVLDHARDPALLLALDGIQDPQNLGAIVRSAEAAAVDGVLLAHRHAASLTGAAAKASA
ncbi:MAG: TrmH family RNA methyltransferase, partial [Candidatus Dormibacteria bacterium]